MKTLAELHEMTKDELVNHVYNLQVASMCNGDEDGGGVPYMGWFWRETEFARKEVQIGKSGGSVRVMENNKWGYPERAMTADEVDKFIEFIDRAIVEDQKGGLLSDIEKSRNAVLSELRDWMNSLADVGEWEEGW